MLHVEPNVVREEIKQRRQMRVTLRHNDSLQQLQDLQWQEDTDEVGEHITSGDYHSTEAENHDELTRNKNEEVKDVDVIIDDTQPCHRMAVCSYSLDDHLLNNDFFYIPLENFFQRYVITI